MIAEVQLAFVILMSLTAMIIAVVIPKFCIQGKIYEKSRKLLMTGTLLVAVHFLVQYIIGKSIDDIDEIRTSVNLLFGFPITFFVNMSLINLIKRGHVKRRILRTIPTLYMIAICTFAAIMHFSKANNAHQLGNYAMAFLYGISLLFVSYVEMTGYVRIERLIKKRKNKSILTIYKWTKTSVFIMLTVSLGFPLMTFNQNELWRSIYGMLSILSAVVYIFNFIGYGLTRKNTSIQTESAVSQEKTSSDDKPIIKGISNDAGYSFSPQKQRQMKIAMSDFEMNEFFTKPGLKMKDAAMLMGTSVFLLKNWLATTEYQKYNIWIGKMRINKAKNLMKVNPNINDKELAESCGFCDRQYFQKTFQKYEGISPSQWIRMNQ